jgi:hypothetical protein
MTGHQLQLNLSRYIRDLGNTTVTGGRQPSTHDPVPFRRRRFSAAPVATRRVPDSSLHVGANISSGNLFQLHRRTKSAPTSSTQSGADSISTAFRELEKSHKDPYSSNKEEVSTDTTNQDEEKVDIDLNSTLLQNDRCHLLEKASNSVCSLVLDNNGLCSPTLEEAAASGPGSPVLMEKTTSGLCSPGMDLSSSGNGRAFKCPHLNLVPSSPSQLIQGLKSPGGQNYLTIGLHIPKSASTAFSRAFTGEYYQKSSRARAREQEKQADGT